MLFNYEVICCETSVVSVSGPKNKHFPLLTKVRSQSTRIVFQQMPFDALQNLLRVALTTLFFSATFFFSHAIRILPLLHCQKKYTVRALSM